MQLILSGHAQLSLVSVKIGRHTAEVRFWALSLTLIPEAPQAPSYAHAFIIQRALQSALLTQRCLSYQVTALYFKVETVTSLLTGIMSSPQMQDGSFRRKLRDRLDRIRHRSRTPPIRSISSSASESQVGANIIAG
jgi:hypothetical protein